MLLVTNTRTAVAVAPTPLDLTGRREATSPAVSPQVEALKSTSIIGGSTVVVLLIRMVRTKILALLLGPAGIGLEAVFDSVVSLARTFFELGISGAGVRQIAAAVGTRNDQVVATTVLTLRRTCLVLGTLGAVTLFLAREPVGRLVFGDSSHGTALGFLAVIVLFGAVAGGQTALLQGLRRIRELATMNILGAATGAVVSVPIVFIWGQAGIPAYMIIASGVALFVSWLYARRVRINAPTLGLPAVSREARGLLKLGVAFMSSGLLSTGALLVLRAIVTRETGVDGAGQFQAANSLSMVYVGFILQSMGTDFYPRLTAVAGDNVRCNRTVNEQAEISLLLALPGILATLALAPWVVRIFYTGQFSLATDILAWQLAGMLLRVVSWPMGFIVLAKGQGVVLVCTEAAAYALYVALAWLGLRWFGLPGTGMAFLGLYLFHSGLMYAVARRLSGFRWSAGNSRLITLAIAAAVPALVVRLWMPEPWASVTGCALAVVASAGCLSGLVRVVGMNEIRRYGRTLALVNWLRRTRVG